MREAICRLPEGATITVHANDTGRTFRRGDVVDLAAVAIPPSGGRAACTWAEVLGAHVDQHFSVTVPASRASRAAAAAAAEE